MSVHVKRPLDAHLAPVQCVSTPFRCNCTEIYCFDDVVPVCLTPQLKPKIRLEDGAVGLTQLLFYIFILVCFLPITSFFFFRNSSVITF